MFDRVKNYVGQRPRHLTDKDYDGWFAAAEKQKPPRSTEDIKREIRRRNPVRWAQIQGDMRWLRRQMKKLGLNPEDARWLL